MAKEKTYKVLLKQKRPHQKGFKIGRHVVKAGEPKEYELNEAEYAELHTAGPMAWIAIVTEEEMKARPKDNIENAKMVEIKKRIKKRVELTGKESLADLEKLETEVKEFDALVKICKKRKLEVPEGATIHELQKLLEESEE